MKTLNIKLLLVCLFIGLNSCNKDDFLDPAPNNLSASDSKFLSADEILDVEIDPADFVAVVDNPYFPLRPGETYHYVGTSKEANETETFFITSTVTCDTKLILGVTTTVVHVIETDEEGTVLEDTFDWYAQDVEGNVWYFGEFTTAFDNGSSSTAGSWEAGIDGAKPGIVMWADPYAHLGETYYQEYFPGEAEDQAKVIPSKRSVKVAYGMFHKTLGTEEFTALEPDVLERKFYAEGIGMVLAQSAKGGKEKEREELVDITFEPCE